MTKEVNLLASTPFFLSEKGYYGYHYLDSSKKYFLSKEILAKPLTWKSGFGSEWKAFLLPHEALSTYKNRSCNVIWVKENDVN